MADMPPPPPQQAKKGRPTGEEYAKGVRHLFDNGVKKVPSRYVLPLPDRPRAAPQPMTPEANPKPKLKLPVIDIGRLLSPTHRAQALQTLDAACKEYGFFQVVNHGIDLRVMERMIEVGRRFFELPLEERAKHMTNDIRGPVRCGTSFNQNKDRVFCWRDFLKLSCHPLDAVLPFWPSSPPDLRDRAGEYSRRMRWLFMAVMGGILESLGIVLESGSVVEELEGGSQLLVVNCFPPCPEPELTLGMPPHSDYGFLTLVLQDDVEGLQVLHAGEWITVDPVPGSLVVNVGDHLEIFSNGRYRSVLHRVLVNSSRSRLSVASLHSLPFDVVVCPSPALVSEDHPKLYMDTNFAAFLDYMSSCETQHKNFLESRKLTPQTQS